MVNLENCYFIEKTIQNNTINDIIEKAKREVELYPVIIPSYKNRSSKMYEYFEENKIKFYVFVYDDDYTTSGYDKYDFKYGTIVRITPEDFAQYGLEGKLLGKKRFYIQKYAEKHSIDKYFTIDDDYNPYNCAKYPVRSNEKRKPSSSNKNEWKVNVLHMPYIDFLKSIQYMFDSYDFSICSSCDSYILYRYSFDVPFIQTNMNGTFLVNNKRLCDNNIFWETEPIFEDDDITIKVKLKGLTWGKISCFASDNDYSRLKTVIPQRDILSLNLYRKYPWCCNIRLYYNTELNEWKLAKIFYNKKITNTNNSYNKEKHEAAIKMDVKEFKDWLAKREGIDLTKSPKEQPKKQTTEEFF